MRFLIWSNEKGAWRAPHGFTWFIERAARYDRAHAQQIVGPTNILPGAGFSCLRETIVPAPEEAFQWGAPANQKRE